MLAGTVDTVFFSPVERPSGENFGLCQLNVKNSNIKGCKNVMMEKKKLVWASKKDLCKPLKKY